MANTYCPDDELAQLLRDEGFFSVSPNDLKKWRLRKKILVDIKGGCCMVCGYDKNLAALDFHHPGGKNFKVSWAIQNFTNRQFEEVLIPEVKYKTMLLCANCHREVTYKKKEIK